MELAGKVVVVTGASMGIGEAIAKAFANEEASVVLLSRDSATPKRSIAFLLLPFIISSRSMSGSITQATV
jgi:NAD(P)-dependent dehydrogenase (short-subunit alcohol dehydrogenase family)